MSDNEDELLLMGTGGGNGEETNNNTNNNDEQPVADVETERKKSKKERRKEKKAKKEKKKKSGRRRQRDDEGSDPDASSYDDEDEDDEDVIDFGKDEIVSDEGSDEEDEDEDDDGKKKNKKKKKNQFIADDVSDGDDEDEDFVDEEAEVDDQDLSYLEAERKKTRIEADLMDDNLDDAELAKRLEARYKQQQGGAAGKQQQQRKGRGGRQQQEDDYDPDVDGFEARNIEDDTAQFGSNFLPRADDAKVFAVKVRGVFSKLLVTRLVNKCYAYLQGQNTSGIRQDLGILSVFSLPHVNEFIYVESHRQKFVETALAGLDGCFRFRITELSADAVMQLFTAPVVNNGLSGAVRKGELLRIRSGPYKLDLGEVVDILEDGKRVLLRLVPRVDFVNKEFVPVKGAGFGKKKDESISQNINSATSARPTQRLFVPALAVGVVSRGPHRYMWGPYEFDEHGFLLKDMTIRQVFCGAAKGLVPEPRPEELHLLFQHDSNALSSHLMSAKPTDAPLQYSSGTRVVYFSERFRLGDPVRVVNGQLAGVTGRIEEMQPSEGRAIIRTQIPQQQQPRLYDNPQNRYVGPQAPATTTMTIDLNETCKLFSVGDKIAVERGNHKGDTGIVLSASGIYINYFSDSGKGHCTAEANDCSSSAPSFARAKTVGAWSLFDLVVLVDDRTVGCIVSLGTDSAEILTQQNSATRVPFSSIKHRVDGRGQKRPTDAFGNQVVPNRETAVEILNIPGAPALFAGRVCGVKAVYEDIIFVRCNEVREHSGIGAVNCKVCRVLSGTRKLQSNAQQLANTLNSERRGGGAGGMMMMMSQQQQQNNNNNNLSQMYNSRGNNNNNNSSTVADDHYGVASAAYTTAYGE